MTSDRYLIATQATPASQLRAVSATAILDDLMARLGVDGLTYALGHTGFLAEIDQHAADIREAIRRADLRFDADSLVSYARSILATVERMGLRMPEPGEAVAPALEWTRAPWHLLRLLAVCAIAEEADWLF